MLLTIGSIRGLQKGMVVTMEGYYRSGEFAKKANVSVRTIRYYDKQELLKPSFVSEAGYRFYTDADFVRLQKILSLKYLGFSLEEIRAITIADDNNDIAKSLELQLTLVRKKIDHLEVVEQALKDTAQLLERSEHADWSSILQLIHLINMEHSLVEQYKDASNLAIRMELHSRYAKNPQSWFSWLFEKLPLKEESCVLEIGCGNGNLWKGQEENIPAGCQIVLTDISSGMIDDAKQNLKEKDCFSFAQLDCQSLPYADNSFDIITANHVLFYVRDLGRALSEIARTLKPGGVFFCSTYGREHMKEISRMVKEFDSRIVLSQINLYEIFGLENGESKLAPYFSRVELLHYKDALEINETAPLLSYILSCHGNQDEYLANRYEEFKWFLQGKLEKKGTLHITKQAGVFQCRL